MIVGGRVDQVPYDLFLGPLGLGGFIVRLCRADGAEPFGRGLNDLRKFIGDLCHGIAPIK